MDCRQARRLLSQGLAPGSSSPDRAALGFHLAGCPNCRAFRDGLQEQLLVELLSAAPGRTQPPTAAPRPLSEHWQLRARLARWLWYAGLGILGTIALTIMIVVVSAVTSLIHTHQNVQ